MDDSQLLRYSRHIMLDEIGIEGQQRLLDATVLIIGLGGLGSPAALYLAAGGVGRLLLADGDTVDQTNLQRQVIHAEDSIGVNKAESARQQIARMSPPTQVEVIPARLDEDSLGEWVARADVVLDCSDNYKTRHAINRACVQHRKPLVSGAALSFAGQLAVFDNRQAEAPCYHCLFPAQGDGGAQNCATFGVFSPLVGVIGTLQAAEAMKLLGEFGQPETGRLLMFDALKNDWQTLRLPKDPQCPVCSTRHDS